jgi:hypothetical protein
MAVVTVQPIILTNVSFAVAADNYESAVSRVEFIPTSSIVNWKGMTPTAVFSFGTAATYVCNVDYAQDWASTNSLSKYLFDNEGTQKVVTFKPVKPATGVSPTWTATVIIAPGSIGGAVDSVAVSSVSLGVVGKPALTTV